MERGADAPAGEAGGGVVAQHGAVLARRGDADDAPVDLGDDNALTGRREPCGDAFGRLVREPAGEDVGVVSVVGGAELGDRAAQQPRDLRRVMRLRRPEPHPR